MGTILVTNLGKAYKQYPNRWSRFVSWIFKSKYKESLKWVLKDVSFNVSPGEAIGIIGLNGAGKSTLLKLITGTIHPTTGKVTTTGRVAAMLELGMGFHPEFTGRQNVYMAGQLLGFSNSEITKLMPEIEGFAEIGDYIDRPVRVYSSGMQMRLAFSVATAKRPDILIVDEALSVGDAYFQHKSFTRIRDFREKGTTLLIVSHDKQAIHSICDKVILLHEGKLLMSGEVIEVLDYYNALLANHCKHEIRQEVHDGSPVKTSSGTREALIESVSLLDENNKELEVVNVGRPVNLRIGVIANEDLPELVVGYLIKNRLGQSVFGTNSFYLNKVLDHVPTGKKIVFDFRFIANLGEGSYSVSVALHTSDSHITKNYEWRDFALLFNVVNSNESRFEGQVWIPPFLSIKDGQ